ncbi:MAG TPA: DUF983 domain-containing protein [Acidimicrobiales bacterium]|nr:DUF983 domain-containing protein [Acidimicrobiales bacterium]
MFRTWFTMLDACPTCHRPFVSEEGFFLGAFVVNLGVTELLLAVVIGVGIALTVPDPPAVTLAALAAAETVIVPVVFYPFSKTIWAALELVMKRR